MIFDLSIPLLSSLTKNIHDRVNVSGGCSIRNRNIIVWNSKEDRIMLLLLLAFLWQIDFQKLLPSLKKGEVQYLAMKNSPFKREMLLSLFWVDELKNFCLILICQTLKRFSILFIRCNVHLMLQCTEKDDGTDSSAEVSLTSLTSMELCQFVPV